MKTCPRCGSWWQTGSKKDKGKRVCPECRKGIRWDSKQKKWVKIKRR